MALPNVAVVTPLTVVSDSRSRGEDRSPTPQQPSLMLIDQRALTRDSLGAWLTGSLSGFMVRLAASVGEAIDRAGLDSHLALVIYHIGGHRVSSPQIADALAQLARELRNVPVAVMADAEDPDAVILALKAGVRGYIPTNLSASAAVEVVRLICAGESYAPTSSFMRQATSRGEGPWPAPPLGGFSNRQLQIIHCLRRGIPNKCIAYELSMSQGTVKVHIRNIMKKLGARNRTQVVIMTNELAIDTAAG